MGTLSRYLDNFSRAAFNMAMRQAPDWADVRQRTFLGCSSAGACSEDLLTEEMRHFVRDVRPVLDKMTALQKESGLEDPGRHLVTAIFMLFVIMRFLPLPLSGVPLLSV